MDSPTPSPIQSGPVPAGAGDLSLPAGLLLLAAALVFFTLGTVAQLSDLASGLFVTQLVCFLLPAVLFARASNTRARSYLRWDRGLGWGELALVLLVSLANYFVAAALMGVCTQLLPESWRFADAARVLAATEGPQLSAIVIAVVVLAPFCEEALFRGALQRGFTARLGPRRAILLTALAFSALHADPIGFLPRVELGLLFGWLAWRTRSLAAPILAHAVNNGAATLLFFAAGVETEPEREAPLGLLLGVMAVGLVVLLPALKGLHHVAPPLPEQAEPPARLDEGRPIALRPDSLELSILGVLVFLALGIFVLFVAARAGAL
ncbi:MAG: CPBP family intramembrane metalloprotease [Deltaproteobacteria bacterium]|nr:CPBP family intramembrane metalloprotease [Deltaproteobacteria bacterium]